MGQVTIYIDEETEKRMTVAAKALRMSKSKWVTNLIREKVADEWPAAVVEIAGSWDDFPSIDDIRSSPDEDLPRENL